MKKLGVEAKVSIHLDALRRRTTTLAATRLFPSNTGTPWFMSNVESGTGCQVLNDMRPWFLQTDYQEGGGAIPVPALEYPRIVHCPSKQLVTGRFAVCLKDFDCTQKAPDSLLVQEHSSSELSESVRGLQSGTKRPPR